MKKLMTLLMATMFVTLGSFAVIAGSTPSSPAFDLNLTEPAQNWVELEKLVLDADVVSQDLTVALTPEWVTFVYLSGDCKVQLPLWETSLLSAGYPATCEGLLDFWSEQSGHEFVLQQPAVLSEQDTIVPTDRRVN